ncbi:MAG: hypothetical protein HZA36_01115 [Parcubacteria group bacterium]|nr:hypothetical protein [Parcubacteria group bacterium]
MAILIDGANVRWRVVTKFRVIGIHKDCGDIVDTCHRGPFATEHEASEEIKFLAQQVRYVDTTGMIHTRQARKIESQYFVEEVIISKEKI